MGRDTQRKRCTCGSRMFPHVRETLLRAPQQHNFGCSCERGCGIHRRFDRDARLPSKPARKPLERRPDAAVVERRGGGRSNERPRLAQGEPRVLLEHEQSLFGERQVGVGESAPRLLREHHEPREVLSDSVVDFARQPLALTSDTRVAVERGETVLSRLQLHEQSLALVGETKHVGDPQTHGDRKAERESNDGGDFWECRCVGAERYPQADTDSQRARRVGDDALANAACHSPQHRVDDRLETREVGVESGQHSREHNQHDRVRDCEPRGAQSEPAKRKPGQHEGGDRYESSRDNRRVGFGARDDDRKQRADHEHRAIPPHKGSGCPNRGNPNLSSLRLKAHDSSVHAGDRR